MAPCPICQHPLSDPPEPRCPSCGADLTPEPGAPPPLAVPPQQDGSSEGGAAASPGIPWQERDRTGFVAALVETTRRVLTAPSAFFALLPVPGGLGSPLLYGLTVGWLGLIAAAFYQALFRSLVGPSALPFGDHPELGALMGWMEGWGGFLSQAIFGGVFVVIGIFISAGIFHLSLLVLGGARRSFEATLQVVAFSQATSVLMLLPFCGGVIGAVWTLVLYMIGLAKVHEIGHGKAAAAVLVPILLFCCCCGAVLAVAFMGLAGVLRQAR